MDALHQFLTAMYPRRCSNTSGIEIPMYAVMRPTNFSLSDKDMIATVAQPDSSSPPYFLLNSLSTVKAANSSQGFCSPARHHALLARYKASSGTPAFGDTWGPKSGQWELDATGSGFSIMGAPTTVDGVDVVPVMQSDASTGAFAYCLGASSPVSVGDGSFVTLAITAAVFSGRQGRNVAASPDWSGGIAKFIVASVPGLFSFAFNSTVNFAAGGFTYAAVRAYWIPAGDSGTGAVALDFEEVADKVSTEQYKPLSLGGLVHLNIGEGLGFKNASGTGIAISLLAVTLGVVKVGSFVSGTY